MERELRLGTEEKGVSGGSRGGALGAEAPPPSKLVNDIHKYHLYIP